MKQAFHLRSHVYNARSCIPLLALRAPTQQHACIALYPPPQDTRPGFLADFPDSGSTSSREESTEERRPSSFCFILSLFVMLLPAMPLPAAMFPALSSACTREEATRGTVSIVSAADASASSQSSFAFSFSPQNLFWGPIDSRRGGWFIRDPRPEPNPPGEGPVSDLQGVPLDPLVEIRICPAPADALIGPNRFVRDLKPRFVADFPEPLNCPLFLTNPRRLRVFFSPNRSLCQCLNIIPKNPNLAAS
jgi:hypothetical protein